jgi:hypothetical protein
MERECMICFVEKSMEEKPEACRHWVDVCSECRASLRVRRCPYCQVDWSGFYPQRMSALWETILIVIALFDSDIELLDFLVDSGINIVSIVQNQRNFDGALRLITGKTEFMDAQIWWWSHDSTFMKQMLLLCQDIVFDTNTRTYRRI